MNAHDFAYYRSIHARTHREICAVSLLFEMNVYTQHTYYIYAYNMASYLYMFIILVPIRRQDELVYDNVQKK